MLILQRLILYFWQIQKGQHWCVKSTRNFRLGFFGGRVWVGFEAKQGQRCCAAWPLPPSKPPSLHLTISIGIRPSRNCPSRLQRILNLTMCFCSLDNRDKYKDEKRRSKKHLCASTVILLYSHHGVERSCYRHQEYTWQESDDLVQQG